MTVPLMAAALIAYGTARMLGTPAIYHALSRDFLRRQAAEGEALHRAADRSS